jgi:hypothetical protein
MPASSPTIDDAPPDRSRARYARITLNGGSRLSRGLGQKGPIAPPKESQRMARPARVDREHVRDCDHVIAGVVLLAERALDPSECIIDRRASRTCMPVDVGEAVSALRREPA